MRIACALMIAISLLASPLLGMPQANADQGSVNSHCADAIPDAVHAHHGVPSHHSSHPSEPQDGHMKFSDCGASCCLMSCMSGSLFMKSMGQPSIGVDPTGITFHHSREIAPPANPGDLETPPPNA